MRIGILYILVSFYLLSCSGQKADTKLEFDYELIENSEIKFPLDKSTSNVELYLEVIEDPDNGRELLAYLSRTKLAILYFDIAEQKLVKEIPLQREGPEGVGKPTGAYVVSWDSIYVIAANNYQVSLIDQNAKVHRRYRLLDGDTYNENTGLIQVKATSPAVKVGNLMYFNVLPDRDSYEPFYYEGKINSSLDLVTGDYEYFNQYPAEFKGKVWGVRGPSYSTTFRSSTNEMAFSFSISDSISVFDLEDWSSERFYGGSKYKKNPVQPFENPNESLDLSDDALRTFHYEGMIYDKYEEVYYRIALHDIELADANSNKLDMFNKTLSIIVLDRDFNILTEKKLEDNKYMWYMYFVSKEGLCIAQSNPHNEDLDEDYLTFTCFEINEL